MHVHREHQIWSTEAQMEDGNFSGLIIMFICVSKINKCLMGLEWNEGKLGELSL